jgi:signal transduction histidine kinase/CheY-like chemotaxis protein
MADSHVIDKVFSRPLREWPGLWCRLHGSVLEAASLDLSRLLGLTTERVDLTEILHPDDRATFAAGGPRVEARARCVDGRWHWLVWETQSADHEVSLCHVRDATEERRAEHRLRLQFAVARELAETTNLRDALPRILESVGSSEGWRVGILWHLDESEQRLVYEASWGEHEPRVEQFVREARQHRFPRGEGVPGLVWQNNAPIWITDMAQERLPRTLIATRAGLPCVCALPLRRGPELFGVIEFFGDESRPPDTDAIEAVDMVCVQLGLHLARAHAENALGHARSRLEYVVKSAPIVLFAADSDGRIVLYDGGAIPARRETPSPMIGRSVYELFAARGGVAHLVGGCFERARAGESLTCMIDGSDGRRYETSWAPLLDEDGHSAGVIGVGLDVSDLEDAKDKLRESERLRIDAERLASLGTLAGGVAHEINNPLTYVNILVGRLVSLEQANRADELSRHRLEMLEEVRDGVGRVEQIVRALRTFSRGDEEGHGAVDVHEALESALRMVGHEIRHRAELVRDFGPVPPVRGSSARLAQVFLNLLVNAAQSMPEGEAHTHELRVSTRVRADGKVVVEIADTGTGIPRELLGKIFEPFFTTRRHGQGSGLGLSIVRGIVSSMGGEISADSELGRGSRFTIVLPAYEGVRPAAPEPRPQPVAKSRRAHVLVVDDDKSVAKVLATVLSEHHQVETARSGREALAALERDPDVDLIICDLMMPEVSGIDLYETIALVRPELKRRFLFMTGGAFTPSAREFLDRVTAPRIEKPFPPDRLLDMVDEVLARAAAEDGDEPEPAAEPRRRFRPRPITRPPRRH